MIVYMNIIFNIDLNMSLGGSGLWVMADERSGLQRNEEASEECLVRVEAVAGWGCGAVFDEFGMGLDDHETCCARSCRRPLAEDSYYYL